MIMTGTLVNCVAVAAGGAVGCLFKKVINEEKMKSVNMVLGLAAFIIGLNGVVSYMITSEDGVLSSSGELKLVVYLVLGTLIGELLKLEERFNNFCLKFEKKFKQGGFASALVTAAAIYCVGAMSVIGSINDGINHDPSVLFVKSTLDIVSSIILGASMGVGVIFATIPMLIYQGGITLLAGSLENLLQGELLNQMCFTGYAVIMAIGLNFFLKNKFRTLNMLPAIFLPIVYHFICLAIK